MWELYSRLTFHPGGIMGHLYQCQIYLPRDIGEAVDAYKATQEGRAFSKYVQGLLRADLTRLGFYPAPEKV